MFPVIKSFVEEYVDLRKFLTEKSEISMVSVVDNHFKKIYLLSCASYYEMEIKTIIKSLFEKQSQDERILSFVTNKAIERQYHTYFDWKKSNINSFFGLFGESFKNVMMEKIKENDDLSSQIKAFLDIGEERNKMVHENFLDYKLEKTFDEINELNREATKFIEYLKIVLI